MEEKSKNNIKGLVILSAAICTLILVGLVGSYAFFISQVEQNKNQEVTVKTGTLELIFNDGNNGFNRELDFGESAEKTFTIENTGSKEGIVSVSWMNLINTYLEGSITYTFLESDTEDGEYTEIISNKNIPVVENATDRVLASGITIPANVKKYYKLIINLNYTDFDQTEDLQAKLETQFKITEGILKDPTPSEETLAKLGKIVKEGEPNFVEAASTNETEDGLFSMEDDYGTSYYYRGSADDNYVKFAGFYWRIIRVNGDGSLRLIYDGTRAHVNGFGDNDRSAILGKTFNLNNDNKYVGYMYGPEGTDPSTSKEEAQSHVESSNAKMEIDTWYKTNIDDKGYSMYLSDTVFCNDRTTASEDETWSSNDTKKGFGKNVTAFKPLSRFLISSANWKTEDVVPSFKCANKNDAFTVEESEFGNGALTYPVGMITADEVNAAGSGIYRGNSRYYLAKGLKYWTLTPEDFTGSFTRVFYVSSDGKLSTYNTKTAYALSPVINISSKYIKDFIGNGGIDDPYRLSTEEY